MWRTVTPFRQSFASASAINDSMTENRENSKWKNSSTIDIYTNNEKHKYPL